MIQAITFLVAFVAGPLMFWGLSRQQPTQRYIVILWIVSVALVITAMAARYLLATGPYIGLGIIFAFWLAWVVVLALFVLVLRRRSLPTRTKRVAFGLAAAATTIPWFGLYTAQMVGE